MEVWWVDAATSEGWHTKDELSKANLIEIRTVGYLTRYDSEVVQVVQSRHVEARDEADFAAADALTVPRRNVRKILPMDIAS